MQTPVQNIMTHKFSITLPRTRESYGRSLSPRDNFTFPEKSLNKTHSHGDLSNMIKQAL